MTFMVSPIVRDTVTILVYTDQLFCHCVFIYSTVVSIENWLLLCMVFFGLFLLIS